MKPKNTALASFLLLSGCSLISEYPDLCSENTQCQSAFGDAHYCNGAGFCDEGIFWKFEAESDDYQHPAGSEDGLGWACNEEAGYLVFGPWYLDFTAGSYTAQYFLKTNEQTLQELEAWVQLGRMDAVASGLVNESGEEGGNTVHLSDAEVTVEFFDTVDYRVFELGFELADSLWDLQWVESDGAGLRPQVELNLYCSGSGYLNVDKVQVLQLE